MRSLLKILLIIFLTSAVSAENDRAYEIIHKICSQPDSMKNIVLDTNYVDKYVFDFFNIRRDSLEFTISEEFDVEYIEDYFKNYKIIKDTIDYNRDTNQNDFKKYDMARIIILNGEEDKNLSILFNYIENQWKLTGISKDLPKYLHLEDSDYKKNLEIVEKIIQDPDSFDDYFYFKDYKNERSAKGVLNKIRKLKQYINHNYKNGYIIKREIINHSFNEFRFMIFNFKLNYYHQIQIETMNHDRNISFTFIYNEINKNFKIDRCVTGNDQLKRMELNNDYQLVYKIINNPDILKDLLHNDDVISRNLEKHFMETKTLDKMINYIKEEFSKDYKAIYDYPSTENLPYLSIGVNHHEHNIKYQNKNGKILDFFFTDYDELYKLKLNDILTYISEIDGMDYSNGAESNY